MSRLPPFRVISYKKTDNLEDTGDDMVFFHVDLEVNEQLYHSIVPFSRLAVYLLKHKPADAAYFNKLRSSINGFGPKETVVLRLAEEEGYDIEKEVMAFIAEECTLEKLIPVNKKQTDIKQAALAEKLDELDALMQESKSFNLRNITFMDEIMDMLNKKVLETYPEIFNSRPEHIITLKSLLIDNVLQFGEAVNNLAWNAHKNE